MTGRSSRGGRPAVGPRISLRIPTDLVDRIDRHAEATGTTRSEILRRGAEELLARAARSANSTGGNDMTTTTTSRFEAAVQIQGGIAGISIDEIPADGPRVAGVATGGINDFADMDVARLDAWLQRSGWQRVGEPDRTHRTSAVEHWRVPVERL